jgi:hypothetical protein
MPFHFECPNCRAKYDVADDMAGKTILCRECEKRVPVKRPGTSAVRAAPPAAAAPGMLTRRKAVLIAVGSVVPAGLMAWVMGYYWKRPLPWEFKKPSEDSEEQPRRRRGRGGPPPDGQAAEGQPAEGQPADGQQGAGGQGKGRGGRGGRRRGNGTPPAPMQ